MKPNFPPEPLYYTSTSSHWHSRTSVYTVRCPQGTVPIRRTLKEDLIRSSSSKSFLIHPLSDAEPGVHIAAMRVKESNSRHYGIRGVITCHNPKVGPRQWSSGQLFLFSDNNAEINTIQAGWIVNPEISGDYETRLFVFWHVRKNGQEYGCWNLLCPGFVQVDHAHPVGHILKPISKYDGPQYGIEISISQDKVTKNWWLVDHHFNIHFGYWPKELVPHLEGGATYVLWGGMASAGANKTSPPMGSGHLDSNGKHTCFCKKLEVIGTEAKYEREKMVNAPKCYDVIYKGYSTKNGDLFYFGGEGGECGT